MIKRAQWQGRENSDTLKKHPVGIFKRKCDFGRRTFGLSGIGNAPMCGHRLARPNRTCFAGGVVANGEHEIERQRARLCELIPRLGTEPKRLVSEALQKLDRVWIYCRLGLTARAIGMKFPLPKLVQDRLGHDGASRVARTEKQDIEWLFLGHIGHHFLRRFFFLGVGPQAYSELVSRPASPHNSGRPLQQSVTRNAMKARIPAASAL